MFGRPLYRPQLPPEQEALLRAQLDSAVRAFNANPGSADALLWLGRRLAYFGHYRDAIAAFTRGITMHPADPRFYRHRGHRYITCRQFDLAVGDLQLAATLVEGKEDQFEPDGQPGEVEAPLNTLQVNIYYHLALAQYLRQDYGQAAPNWLRARALARNDDMAAATSYWLYLTYRKLGRVADAAEVLRAVRPNLRPAESRAYYDLLRMFRGELAADSVARLVRGTVQTSTYGYGLASWLRLNGESARADALLREITNGKDWAAFGFIAAETELERAARPF
jgi:tetratricopeptide (TPR) repeat protein